MNYNHLRYFHVVSETGSLTAAARELGVTVPTVSEQIKQLETTVGHRLFDRTGSGLRLTEVGRVTQQHTSIMFREGERLSERLEMLDQPDRHRLEIGVSSTVSRAMAAESFLPLFRIDSLFARIHSGEEPQLLHALSTHEFDLIVTDQPIPDAGDRGIEIEVLHRPRMLAVASGGLAERVERFPFDLGSVPFLHYTRSSRYRWEIDRFFREHGILPKVVGEVSDIGILRAVAAQGVAAVVLPRSAVDRTVEVLGELPSLRSDVLVAYRSEEPSEFVKTAVAALRSVEGA